MQHSSSSSSSFYSLLNNNNQSSTISDPAFKEKQQLVQNLETLKTSSIRREADHNLSRMGRYIRDIFDSAGESNKPQSVSDANLHKHKTIHDWSFYDEHFLEGSALTDRVSKDFLDKRPELKSIATWIYEHMSQFIEQQFDVEYILNLHELPESKCPQATHNPEAEKTFVHHLKHELPSSSSSSSSLEDDQEMSWMLTAHAFMLYKFDALKLYFITDGPLLIDFFFWQVPR